MRWTLDDIRQPALWRSLIEGLRLSESRDEDLLRGTRFEATPQECERFDHDGYFSFDGVLDRARVAALREGAEILHEQGIPEVFLVLFDAFWEIIAEADGTTRALVGGDYRVLPRMWVWYVDPSREEAGWPPHREHHVDVDGWDPEDPVESVGFWVSLTDVTPDRSPIVLLPVSKDPGYPHEIVLSLEDFASFRTMIVPEASLIGWHQSVLHWGARSSRWTQEPRISLGWEVAVAGSTAWTADATWTCQRPAWNRRLRLAGAMLLQYEKFHDWSEDWLELSRELLSRVPK